jgi:hypothetical protein
MASREKKAQQGRVRSSASSSAESPNGTYAVARRNSQRPLRKTLRRKKVKYDPIAIKKVGYMFVYLSYETRTIHHEDIPSCLRLAAR